MTATRPPRPSKPGTPAPHVNGTQACAGADINLFFPRQGASNVAAARRICDRCPIQAKCIDYALTAVGVAGIPVDGVWGGTTRDERAAMRKRLGLRLDGGIAA